MPTHFVAIRVDDRSVLETVNRFHDYLKKEDPVLEFSLCQLSKLHVTLLVLDCPRSAIKKVTEAMIRVAAEHSGQHFRQRPLELRFSGVEHLKMRHGHDLLFTRVTPTASPFLLRALIRDLKQSFHNIPDVSVKDDPFHHFKGDYMALLNSQVMGRPVFRHFKPDICSPFKHIDFGKQRVGSLQLLSTGPREQNGFYNLEAEVTLINE